MQISKILLIASVIANGLLIGLRLSEGSLEAQYKENANKSIKVAEKVSFNVGCMQALSASMHLNGDDPLEPVYQDWCTKSAAAFSRDNVISVK